METQQEIDRQFDIRRNILIDATISHNNAKRLASFQRSEDEFNITRDGFYSHLYRTYRFAAVTQLSKLINPAKNQKFSLHKLGNKIIASQFCIQLSHKSKAVLRAEVTSIIEGFSQANPAAITKIKDQRDKVYAHTDDQLVTGMPDEQLDLLIKATHRLYNRLHGLIGGPEHLFASLGAWSIDGTLRGVLYAYTQREADHIQILKQSGETDEQISETLARPLDKLKQRHPILFE